MLIETISVYLQVHKKLSYLTISSSLIQSKPHRHEKSTEWDGKLFVYSCMSYFVAIYEFAARIIYHNLFSYCHAIATAHAFGKIWIFSFVSVSWCLFRSLLFSPSHSLAHTHTHIPISFADHFGVRCVKLSPYSGVTEVRIIKINKIKIKTSKHRRRKDSDSFISGKRQAFLRFTSVREVFY